MTPAWIHEQASLYRENFSLVLVSFVCHFLQELLFRMLVTPLIVTVFCKQCARVHRLTYEPSLSARVSPALKLPLGKTTVMHLVARETLPEPNSQGNQLSDSLCSFSGLLSQAKHLLNIVLPAIIYLHTGQQFKSQLLVEIIGSLWVYPMIRRTVFNVQVLSIKEGDISPFYGRLKCNSPAVRHMERRMTYLQIWFKLLIALLIVIN